MLPGPPVLPDALPLGLHRGCPGPPLLRKFAVPFWALTELYGRSPMYWYRLERSLGRFSVVGTTVQAADHLPRHLVADEKHTTLIQKKTRKVYLATTVGGGCCLGIALAEKTAVYSANRYRAILDLVVASAQARQFVYRKRIRRSYPPARRER